MNCSGALAPPQLPSCSPTLFIYILKSTTEPLLTFFMLCFTGSYGNDIDKRLAKFAVGLYTAMVAVFTEPIDSV